MRAIEFESTLNANGQITVPPEVASQLPTGGAVRVVVLWDAQEEEHWRLAGIERFAAAYSPEDSVYEALLGDAPAR